MQTPCFRKYWHGFIATELLRVSALRSTGCLRGTDGNHIDINGKDTSGNNCRLHLVTGSVLK